MRRVSLFALVVLSLASLAVAHPLDDDDAQSPAAPVIAPLSAAEHAIANQEKLAESAIADAERLIDADAQPVAEHDDANDEAALSVNSEAELPLRRLAHLKRWKRFSKRDWRRMARRWRRLDPYTQRVIAKKIKKTLKRQFSAFSRKLAQAVRAAKTNAARSRVRLPKKRAIGFKNGRIVLSKGFKMFKRRFSRFGKTKGAKMRPSWARSRKPRRVRGWNLVATRRYVDSSCHTNTAIWTLRADGIARRYVGSDRLVSIRRAPGGLIQISTSCDGQLWGLNAFGRVFRWSGKRSGWEATNRGPKFVKMEAGNDDQVYGLTRAGKLFRLRSDGQWGRVGRGKHGITLRDISVTCDGQVVGVNRHWRVAVVVRGKLRKLAQSPRVKQVASATRSTGVYAVTHDGRVYRFTKGRWGRIPKLLLDQIGVSRSGEVCGTYGRNLYLNWAGRRPPSTNAYRRLLGLTKGNLQPEGRDPSPLLRHPFSLGKFRKDIDAKSAFASPTPEGPGSKNAYVRDNLPVSAMDFKSLAPALPGQFQTYSYKNSPQNDAVKDPLPDTKQELTISLGKGRFNLGGFGGNGTPDRQNAKNIMKGIIKFPASATPGSY